MSSFEELLIDGYIRKNEKLLHPKIIPVAIHLIVLKFYYMRILIYVTLKNKLTVINCSDVIKKDINIRKCKLINSKSITTTNNYDCSTHTRRCIAKNVSLSENIQNEMKTIKNKTNSSNGPYDIIFRCGGYANGDDATCSAVIINQLQINKQSNDEVFNCITNIA